MDEEVNYNIELRMRQLIHNLVQGKPDWKGMEKLTGTKAVKWRHFIGGLKKPSVEMFESLCTSYPQFAFWLATGISDEDAGHLAPGHLGFPGKLSGGQSSVQEQEATANYFKACQQAAQVLWDAYLARSEERSGRVKTQADMSSNTFGLGSWMRTEVLAAMLGKEAHDKLVKNLARQQRSHLAESLLRLRVYGYKVDDIIDKQREEEEKLGHEVDEWLEQRKASNEESKIKQEDTLKDGDKKS